MVYGYYTGTTGTTFLSFRPLDGPVKAVAYNQFACKVLSSIIVPLQPLRLRRIDIYSGQIY